MLFYAIFNSISVTSWRSVLFVEETRVPGENHQPAASHWQTLSHYVVSSTPWEGLELTTLVVIGTDCIGSCKSNYRTITTTTAPQFLFMSCPNTCCLCSCLAAISSLCTFFIFFALVCFSSFSLICFCFSLNLFAAAATPFFSRK